MLHCFKERRTAYKEKSYSAGNELRTSIARNNTKELDFLDFYYPFPFLNFLFLCFENFHHSGRSCCLLLETNYVRILAYALSFNSVLHYTFFQKRKKKTSNASKSYHFSFSHSARSQRMPASTRPANVHPLPDARAGERVPLQPLPDPATEDRNCARPVSDRAADQNLVPKSPDEAEEGTAGGEGN